ncbi:MAG: CRTAC1 family protein, partial [Bacteroidota bacterium]
MKSLLPLLFSVLLAQAAAAQIQFAELPGLAFLDSTSYLNGVIWVDVDNDYDLDVSVSGFGGTPPNFVNKTAIFRNLGGGVFINDSLVVSSQSTPMRHGWADIDNNGWLDVYYGATWNFGGVNELWLNDNDTLLNQFTGSGATSNLPQPYEGTVSWGDYDNDGFVDLFLARWNDLKNQLFRNNGDSTFTEITTGALVNDLAWTSGGFWGDFNNDGWLDIYVVDYQEGAATPGTNDLFVNNGDGTFTKLGATAGDIATAAENTRSANWVDANNDGWLDIFVVNQLGQNKLYLNNGDSTFFTMPIGDNGQTTWSSNWGDYDNDGDQDLVTLGFFGSESRFWRNDFMPGSGVTFTDITLTHPNIFPTDINGSNSNGVIWVDYDLDGWLDLHITQPDLSADHFYRNLGDTCITWIEIKLTGGDSSNVAGIGAVIRAKANVNGNDTWQKRQVSAQTASTGSNPLWQHFGFHKAETIDSLVVEWTSGQVCVFTEVDVNQVIEILESCEINVIVPQPKPGNSNALSFCFPAGDTTLVPQISNGEWSATCGDCISQNGNFNGGNLPPGGYSVTYSQGDGICDSTDTWLINIIDPTGVELSFTFCPNQGDQQLFPPSGATGGTWSASCGNCINAQGVLAVSTLPVDVYQVFYKYQGPCGELTDEITVNIQTNIAGDDTEVNFCPGSPAKDLFPLIEGNPQTNGQFFNANFQPVTMPFSPTAATTPRFYIVGTGACT